MRGELRNLKQSGKSVARLGRPPKNMVRVPPPRAEISCCLGGAFESI